MKEHGREAGKQQHEVDATHKEKRGKKVVEGDDQQLLGDFVKELKRKKSVVKKAQESSKKQGIKAK